MECSYTAENWWTTPVLRVQNTSTESFRENLASIILEKEQELRTLSASEPVAGLRSGITTLWREYNVLHWDYPECAELKEILLIAWSRFIALIGKAADSDYQILGIAAWANVLRHGESMHIHHHDQAFANAHYLVCSGETLERIPHVTDSGHTVYYRPGFIDRSHGERQGETINPWDSDWRTSVPATEGQMMFFPSYVRHEVRTYLGARCRISIAFDFYIKKQQPLIHFGGPQWYVP